MLGRPAFAASPWPHRPGHMSRERRPDIAAGTLTVEVVSDGDDDAGAAADRSPHSSDLDSVVASDAEIQ